MSGGGITEKVAGKGGRGSSVSPSGPSVTPYAPATGAAPIDAPAAQPIVPAGGFGNDPYSQSAQAYRDSLGLAGQPSDIASGMGKYANPYTQQVIDRGMADLERQRQLAQGSNAQGAINAGAFGGSRHGLVEAQTNAEAARAAGDLSAGLHHQGWNTAAQLAGQDVSNRFGQSGLLSGLAGQGFGFGNTLTDRQMQQGGLQQQLLQSILTGGSQQFDQFMQSPYNALDIIRSGIAGNPLQGQGTQTTTAQNNPGKGGALSLLGQGVGMAMGGPAGAAAGGKGGSAAGGKGG